MTAPLPISGTTAAGGTSVQSASHLTGHSSVPGHILLTGVMSKNVLTGDALQPLCAALYTAPHVHINVHCSILKVACKLHATQLQGCCMGDIKLETQHELCGGECGEH